MLPELERAVNEDPGYHALRAMFLWRVVSEWYQAGSAGADKDGDTQTDSRERNRKRLAEFLKVLDAAWWIRRMSDSWTPAGVFERYAKSAMEVWARLLQFYTSSHGWRIHPLSVSLVVHHDFDF